MQLRLSKFLARGLTAAARPVKSNPAASAPRSDCGAVEKARGEPSASVMEELSLRRHKHSSQWCSVRNRAASAQTAGYSNTARPPSHNYAVRPSTPRRYVKIYAMRKRKFTQSSVRRTEWPTRKESDWLENWACFRPATCKRVLETCMVNLKGTRGAYNTFGLTLSHIHTGFFGTGAL